MKIIILGFLIWSVSSIALALPFTHGALSYITRSGGGVTTDGGDGVVSSNAVYNPAFSTAEGRAISALNQTNAGQPMNLDALALGSTTGFVNSDASAIQRFRYTGSTATTINATGFFRGNISSSGSSNRITGRIALIAASGDMDTLISDFLDRTLFNDLGSTGAHSALTSARQFVQTISPGTLNQNRTVSLAVNPNDEFFLYGQLNVNGALGVSADAWAGSNGARYILDNSSNLVAVSAVPVPAAVWLMGSALVGLLGFKRKTA